MKRIGLLAALVAGGLITLVWVLSFRPDSTSALAPTKAWFRHEWGPFALAALLFPTMLAGILLCQLFQVVVSKPDEQVRFTELMKTLNSGRSWAAMLASPIVFFSTLSSLLELGITSTAFFYALQNGFFCLAIFNTISAKFSQNAGDG